MKNSATAPLPICVPHTTDLPLKHVPLNYSFLVLDWLLQVHKINIHLEQFQQTIEEMQKESKLMKNYISEENTIVFIKLTKENTYILKLSSSS